jgi:hypothetical protein
VVLASILRLARFLSARESANIRAQVPLGPPTRAFGRNYAGCCLTSSASAKATSSTRYDGDAEDSEKEKSHHVHCTLMDMN